MKKKVIILSILGVIVAMVALTAIVVGAVFRVRSTTIVRLGEDEILTTNEANEQVELTDEQILSASGIKKGNSTLFLNKDKAISKIEAAYPYIRVVQIRITSAQKIELRVTARHEMFYYTTNNADFFILDEELKVLRVAREKPDNLIPINPRLDYRENGNDKTNYNIFAIDEDTKAGNFVAGGMKNVFNSLYLSMYKTVLVNTDGSLWLDKTEETDVQDLIKNKTIRYIERADFGKVLKSVEFKTKYTLTESYLSIVLKTQAGVQIEIGKPDNEMQTKVNYCFSLVSMLNSGKNEDGEAIENATASSGIVAYEYDENGAPRVRYYLQNQ